MTSGEVIAFAGLGVGFAGLVVHALRQAVEYGSLRQRVKHLEDAAVDNKEIAKLVIQMAEKVDGFGKRLDQVAKDLTWLTTVPPETPGLIATPTHRRRSGAKS